MFSTAFQAIVIIMIVSPRHPKCKLKAIFVCLVLSGSLGIIFLSVSLVFCMIGRLQSFHSSLIRHTFQPLSSASFWPLLIIHRLHTSASLHLSSSVSYLRSLLPLIYPLSSRPSSVFPSITPSHKWTVQIPSEYRSERALVSNEQRMNKRWRPLS